MKRYFPYILLLTLACNALHARADKEVSYLPQIELRKKSITRVNRRVEVDMEMDLSRMNVRTQHAVTLTPVLVSADGRQKLQFQPVVVDGSTRHKVFLRAQQLSSVEMPPRNREQAMTVIRRRNGKEQTYAYRASVPYERWMLGGHMELHEEVTGCANCQRGNARLPLPEGTEALKPFSPQFDLELMVPQPEEVKRRQEVRVARLQFRWDSYRVEPAYKGNRAELDTIEHSINVVRDNPDLTITGIHITGYASPEGPVPYNLKLSRNRADALAEYVQKHTHTDAALWHVKGVGEDWDGLRLQVQNCHKLLKAEEVLRIIDECRDNRDACEERIKALVPPTIYERVVNELYGPLRRNEYRIAYNVRNFDPEEAKRLIREQPKLLSLHEMFTVANAYGKQSAEYTRCLEIAAATYPDRKEAVVNLAALHLEQGRTEQAVSVLEQCKLKDDPEVLNALGVAYARAGRLTEARRALEQAARQGHRQAEHNLEQVKGLENDL